MGKKLTFDFVKNKFEEINYTLLETEYINNWTKMKCICNNHPDLIQYKTYGDVSQKLRDQIKIDYCKKKNIQLLIIPYTEFKNIESILNEKLGLKNATII